MNGRSSLPLVVTAFLLGILASPQVFGIETAKAQTAVIPCDGGSAEVQTPEASDAPVADQSPASDDAAVPPVPAEAHVPRARFSEVLPDPAGADDQGEFIEIANGDGADADLAGWKIENAAGKTFPIAVRLGPKARYAFTYAETKIPLVNSGMTLTLRDPAGEAADTLTYPGPAKTGKAFARDTDGTWRWTSTPTPGSENAFDPPPQEPVPVATAESEATAPDRTVADTAAPPAVQAAPEPVPAENVAVDVSIVELMPNPPGDDADEWIALENGGTTEVRLDGLKLDDADGGSTPFALAGIRIASGGRVRIPRSDSKLSLNNDGDSVRLLGPDDVPLRSVTYGIAPEGKTYALVDGAWKWLPEDAVPASVPASAATQDDAASGPTDGAADAAEQPVPASIGDIAPDDDSLLEIDGVVTLPPGVAGKRTFAMQDAAGMDGLFVRVYGSTQMPSLIAGDRVRVVGRAGRGGVARFATAGGLVRRVAAGTLTFDERPLAEIDEDAVGTAVAVTGIVTRGGKTVLTIADADGRTELTVRAAPGTAFGTKYAAGTTVAVKGVPRPRGGKTELLVTGNGGISLLARPAAESKSSDPSAPTNAVEKTAPPPAREPIVFGYSAEKTLSGVAVGGIAAAAVAAAAVIVVMIRRRRSAELERLAADR